MAITRDFNKEPYFDDFEQNAEQKGYHQILFRPGFAVQTRELNQLQTILQEQVARFGTSIYQHGSVVVPGNSYADLSSTFLRIDSINAENITPSYFENKKVRGVTSGTEAKVRKSVDATEDDPITFYVENTSGGESGQIEFDRGENIEIIGQSEITASIKDSSEYTGLGTLAFVDEGVYFISGYFVLVEAQSIVVDKYSNTPSASILLRIDESVVTSNEDQTLLDNSQGTFNFAAPGANRYVIDLTLVAKPLSEELDDNYVELIRYKDGELREHQKTPQYSELEKELARRTFDESGNYVVDGLKLGVREHLKGGNNRNGVYPPPRGDNDKLVVELTSGKAYVNGFEVDKLGKTRIEIDKSRTSDHIRTTDLVTRPQFGQYIIVGDLTGSLELQNREEIEIYDSNDPYASDATLVGRARVVAIDFLIDDPGTVGSIHKLWISQLNFEPGFSIEDSGGIAFGNNDSALVLNEYRAPVNSGAFDIGETIDHSSGRSATVEVFDAATGIVYAYRHDNSVSAPLVGDQVTGSVSSTSSVIRGRRQLITAGDLNPLIFRLGKNAPLTFIDPETNAYNLSYTVQKELVITTDSNGDGSTSVSSGQEIDPIETGTFLAFGPSGIVDDSLFSLNTDGSTLTLSGGPASSTVRVYAAVTKTDVSPKTKTVATKSKTFSSPGAGTLTLDDTDIISVESIIDDTGDITASYTVDNGQRDTVYLRGRLIPSSSSLTPVGDVVVNYTHYEHSISGDFFNIDSYSSDVLERDVFYTSTGRSTRYELPRCIDFRPSVGTNGEIEGTGGRPNDLIISGTTFRSKLQFFVPRIDLVTVTQEGNIRVIRGNPSSNPSAPTRPKNELALETLYVPEYTKAAQDVNQKRLTVNRYRMKDIHNMNKRLDNIEDFATLTAQELEVTGYDVTDAETGLNKFKSGYLVESFKNAFLTARTTSEDFSANFAGENLEAPHEQESIKFNFDKENSSNVVNRNGYLMLPYTEVTFASQSLSSRTTNLNPFLVISWDGILEVDPPVDEWVEIRDRATVFEEDTEVNEVVNYVDCPPDPDPPDIDSPDDDEPDPEPEEDSFLFEVKKSDGSDLTYNFGDLITFDNIPVGERFNVDYIIEATQESGTVIVGSTAQTPGRLGGETFVDGEQTDRPLNITDGTFSESVYGYNAYELSEGESVTVTLSVTNSQNLDMTEDGAFEFVSNEPNQPSQSYRVRWSGTFYEEEEEEVGDPTFKLVCPSSVDKGDTLEFNVETTNYSGTVYWDTVQLNTIDISGTQLVGEQNVSSSGSWSSPESITF